MRIVADTLHTRHHEDIPVDKLKYAKNAMLENVQKLKEGYEGFTIVNRKPLRAASSFLPPTSKPSAILFQKKKITFAPE